MLPSRFQHHLATLGLSPGVRVLVAVSGGADSVALLDLLVRTGPAHELHLLVAHLDHGINPDSQEIASRVEELARSYGLRCLTGHLSLGAGASETVARERRHAWLEDARQREDAEFVLMAHQADDQAETVLLRMLHGSGPAGLAAMASKRDRILRPLLPFRREELVRYLHERGLSWWEDPANQDPRHLRSWVRQSLLPRIRERVPEGDANLRTVAAHAALEREAWDHVIDVLPALEWKEDREGGGSVAVAPLAGYDSALGSTVLRSVARRVGCRLGTDGAARALELVRRGESGTRCDLGNDWILEIVFGRASFVGPGRSRPLAPDSPIAQLDLAGDAGQGMLGRWRFAWRADRAPERQKRDDLTAWFIPGTLHARAWTDGDRVRPLGGAGRRLVVRCFQDAKVPAHLRESWPVVRDQTGEIVWVPGVCRSDRLVPPAGAEGRRVDAQVL